MVISTQAARRGTVGVNGHSVDVDNADVEFRFGVNTGTVQQIRPGPLMTRRRHAERRTAPLNPTQHPIPPCPDVLWFEPYGVLLKLWATAT